MPRPLHLRLTRAVASALACCTLLSCSARGQQRTPRPSADSPPTGAKPTLVLLITVDQLASDYLTRYGANLKGGLKRLRDEGALWVRGVHDHAITETAPGHASTLSGRFPVHTGISSNSQGVNTPDAPLLGSSDLGASPFRFRGTTLFDWMSAADPTTRVLSVSRKDRGAILPIGQAKRDVYWYASNGEFTTSTYYRAQLPPWVTAFNARRVPQSYAGKAWTPLLAADRYAEPDTVPIESGGSDGTFPHLLAADPAAAARGLREFPWMDSLTLAFALEGARRLELGATGTRTDLLAVSLSSTDAIGHRFGPDSKEIHDQILHLDRYLGLFLDSLFALRDQRRVVIVLTADHGVAPYPELRSPYYSNGAAQRVNQAAAWGVMQQRLREAGIDTSALFFDDGVRVRNPEAFRRANAEPDSFAAVWVREMRRVNGVLRADLITDLTRADTVDDVIARRWLHMFDRDGPVRAVVTFTPYSYWLGVTYATHGSVHDYDARVPILFWGSGIAAGARGTEARVVDIAPTLAAWLGVTPLEPLDGRPLPLRP